MKKLLVICSIFFLILVANAKEVEKQDKNFEAVKAEILAEFKMATLCVEKAKDFKDMKKCRKEAKKRKKVKEIKRLEKRLTRLKEEE